MKLLTLIAVLTFSLSAAFANHHEKGHKKKSHDKEHSHVEESKKDHDHDEEHHKPHDHKAHHPTHDEDNAPKKK